MPTLRSQRRDGTTSSEMTFLFLGIVVAVVLLFVLNPKRWKALGDSARDLRGSFREGEHDDDDQTG